MVGSSPVAARTRDITRSSRPQSIGTKVLSFAKTVTPNFCTENRSPIAEITPMLHGPFSAATDGVPACLGFAAVFFLAAALAGAGDAGGGDAGACAEAAVTRNDRKQARITRVMISGSIAVLRFLSSRGAQLQAARTPKNYGFSARFQR